VSRVYIIYSNTGWPSLITEGISHLDGMLFTNIDSLSWHVKHSP
jgi:hypothetical protein